MNSEPALSIPYWRGRDSYYPYLRPYILVNRGRSELESAPSLGFYCIQDAAQVADSAPAAAKHSAAVGSASSYSAVRGNKITTKKLIGTPHPEI